MSPMKTVASTLLLAALISVAYAGVEVTTNPDLRCVVKASPEVAHALYL